jgi:hypothetical protein
MLSAPMFGNMSAGRRLRSDALHAADRLLTFVIQLDCALDGPRTNSSEYVAREIAVNSKCLNFAYQHQMQREQPSSNRAVR